MVHIVIGDTLIRAQVGPGIAFTLMAAKIAVFIVAALAIAVTAFQAIAGAQIAIVKTLATHLATIAGVWVASIWGHTIVVVAVVGVFPIIARFTFAFAISPDAMVFRLAGMLVVGFAAPQAGGAHEEEGPPNEHQRQDSI
jgi:hypothetical protein